MTNFKNFSAKQLISKLNSTKNSVNAEDSTTIIAILTKRNKLPAEFTAPKAEKKAKVAKIDSFEIKYRKRTQTISKGSMVMVGQPSNQEYQAGDAPYIAEVVSMRTIESGSWVRLHTWVSGAADAKVYKYTWKKLEGIYRVLKAQTKATKVS